MKIYGTRTIEEYKTEQKRHIEKWIDDNFIEGSVTWKMQDALSIKVTDKKGDSMIVSLDEIE